MRGTIGVGKGVVGSSASRQDDSTPRLEGFTAHAIAPPCRS